MPRRVARAALLRKAHDRLQVGQYLSSVAGIVLDDSSSLQQIVADQLPGNVVTERIPSDVTKYLTHTMRR